MLKRLISFMTCIVMLTSIFSGMDVTVLAEEESSNIISDIATAEYSGECGDNLVWVYDDSADILTISGAGDMYDYTAATVIPWSSYTSRLKSVIIENGVTSIGNHAFAECTALENVVIPDSVVSIGSWAFTRCASLITINIPDSVQSIGIEAFYGTGYYNNSSNWKDDVIYISNHLIKAKTSVSGAYSVLPGTVTIADAAFEECNSLDEVTIPDSVTNIGEIAFHYFYGYNDYFGYKPIDLTIKCKGNSYAHIYAVNNGFDYDLIEAGGISGSCGDSLTWTLDTEEGILEIYGTGEMYSCFKDTTPWYEYCDLIKTVIIGDGVTRLSEELFYQYDSLETVIIGDSVTSLDYLVFSECKNLKNVTLGDSLASIGVDAFYGCESLESIVMPDSVEDISQGAFSYCKSLRNVELGDSLIFIGYMVFMGCESLEGIVIPESVRLISSESFSLCSSLKTLGIESDTVYIENFAFSNCTALSDISVSDSAIRFETSVFSGTAYYNNADNWTDNALYLGSHLLEVKPTVSGEYHVRDGSTDIAANAFYNCNDLTSVVLPDSLEYIGYYAFSGCSSLRSITIPESVTEIMDSFDDCSLTIKCYKDSYAYNYAIENNIPYEYIGTISGVCGDELTWSVDTYTGVLSIDGNGAMYDYPTVLDEHETGLYVTTAPWYEYIPYIEKINIGSGVTYIGENAFYRCNNVVEFAVDEANEKYSSLSGILYNKDQSVLLQFPINSNIYAYTIPDSVTTIGDDAVAYCRHLSEVIMPSSVTTIGSGCFEGCYNLVEITVGDSVSEIGDSAFAFCSKLDNIYIPDSVKSIGDTVFFCCGALERIYIPATVTVIGDDSFYGCPITVECYQNSYAHNYAIQNKVKYELIYECSFTVYTTVEATCTEDAYKIAYCDNGCGEIDMILLEGTALGHAWTEWMITVEPTYTIEGEKVRFCTVCKLTEGEKISKLEPPYDPNKPEITVDNFTVIITNADNIKDMRYAPGKHATTSEIRNAYGNVAISAALVEKYTLDGRFVYEMPNGGYYTVWIRMKDGTNYILPLPVTDVNASVSSYGVKITVHDLFDVKDFYIAKGEYTTYREIKDNGYIFSATAVKIGTKHDYTYTVYEPGMHTILIRYNDGRTVVFHEELVVDEPVFTANGLQMTVSNIPDVKVIRTAYGEWNTVKELKATDTLRNFSAKTAIKGNDPYTIQYREDGMVTIIVEYNNGYQKVFHYNVQHKQAGCMQTLSTVIFDDLDGFSVIRYAMGEYETSAQIKRAEGSKVIKPVDVTGEYAIVSGLAKGIYTFCVQFDDESYNYFTVTIK